MFCASCESALAEHRSPAADVVQHPLPTPGTVPERANGDDEEVRLWLAEANLLRLRGHYEEAIGYCTRILRVAPGNAAAHSVLGDVYEAQGNFTEALGWYKLAVQLAPTNQGDRQKLDNMIDRVYQSTSRPAEPSRPPVAASGAPHPRFLVSVRALLAKLQPIHLVMGCTVVGIGATLLIYILTSPPPADQAMAGTGQPAVTQPMPDANTLGSATVTDPSVTPPPPDPIENGTANPAVTTPTPLGPTGTTKPPVPGETSPAARPNLPQPLAGVPRTEVTPYRPTNTPDSGSPEGLAIQAEPLKALLSTALKESKTPNAILNQVAIDAHTATVTLVYTVPLSQEPSQTKKVLLYAGFTLVWTALGQNHAYKSFTLQGNVTDGTASPATRALLADITAQQAQAAARHADYRSVVTYLTDPLWSADLAAAPL